MIPAEIIKKKRNKGHLSAPELAFMVNGYTSGTLPDYQMASLLMAIFFNGMNDQESSELTQIMLDSGKRVQFAQPKTVVDKHSTGGVGDKTSLILAPLLAACGVKVPMMSGRGLGHTGGTVDKLESIPGFTTALDLETFQKQVETLGCAMISQTGEICPADKKIYGLRDVTATVESLPLICASIMSKKIAEGIGGLVLDVKCGSGAFMKNIEDAKALAMGLTRIGKNHDLAMQVLVTNMNQPLGAFVGNLVEVAECLAIMTGGDCLGADPSEFSDCRDLTVELATHMLVLGDSQYDIPSAKSRVLQALNSGEAFEVFARMCQQQGADLAKITLPRAFHTVVAPNSGYIHSFDTEKIGIAAIEMGAGRKTITDILDPKTGIQVHQKIGNAVQAGEPLFTLFCGDREPDITQATQLLKKSVTIAAEPQESQPLVFLRL